MYNLISSNVKRAHHSSLGLKKLVVHRARYRVDRDFAYSSSESVALLVNCERNYEAQLFRVTVHVIVWEVETTCFLNRTP